MIIEQAFMALPEFLVGAPYLQYDSEATLVMAYAMSLLQELNGRNVNNPISFVRGEVRYPTATNRRADLHLRLSDLNIDTDELRQYGYRPEVWMEAKFFRRNDAGDPMITGTPATLHVLTDLIRLCCLPPETVNQPANCGRYLLHAYQGLHTDFLKARKNVQKAAAARPATATRLAVPARPASPGFIRSWTKQLVTPGSGPLDGFSTLNEVAGFNGIVGGALRGIQLKIQATTFAHLPTTVTANSFLVALTRLDRVEVHWTPRGAQALWFVVEHGSVTEGANNDFAAIQQGVAQGLA